MPREQPTELLAAVSATAYDRLDPQPVGDLKHVGDERGLGWMSTADLLIDPSRLDPLVDAGCGRFRSDDRPLVVAQLARESVAALVTVAVDLWVRQRRLLDLSAANVVLRAGPKAVVAGLRRPNVVVLADDPMVGQDDVEVIGEDQMFDRLVDQSVGYPVPAGAVPPGGPASIAAVAAIIATVRQVVRCGERHLWGTAALAAASTAARLSHTLGPRADQDLAALLATRPDLDRTIELVTVDDDSPYDGPDSDITFALRRTCCLLYKLPDRSQCATCSLRDRECQIAELSDWYRNQRRRLRDGRDYGWDGDGGAPGTSSSISSS
jgi:hypothetical protein